MAEQPDTTPSDDGRAKRLARRQLQRRRLRRRRLGAAAALFAVVMAVAGLVAFAGSGKSSRRNAVSRPKRARAVAATGKAGAEASGPVRNATPQPGWKPYTGPVPILEYHVLGAPPAGASYPELYVTRRDFRQEMDWLDAHGYQAVTLETVEDAWYRGGHLDLTTLDAARVKEEVAGSRQILRREYGVPVADFCYPAGRFDDTVTAAVKAAGYAGATTEIPGYAEQQKPLELSRFEVRGSTGISGLSADLASG